MSRLPPNTSTTDEIAEAEEQARQEEERHFMLWTKLPKDGVHGSLRRFRERRGYKKGQMADFMGVTARSYYAYEAGTRSVPSDSLIKLAALTDADLNEVLLGRSAILDTELVDHVMRDFTKTANLIAVAYPGMDLSTAMEVAKKVIRPSPNAAPISSAMIDDAVRLVARYRFHPEHLPPPPIPEDYGNDHEQYKKDTAEWERIVDEDIKH